MLMTQMFLSDLGGLEKFIVEDLDLKNNKDFKRVKGILNFFVGQVNRRINKRMNHPELGNRAIYFTVEKVTNTLIEKLNQLEQTDGKEKAS